MGRSKVASLIPDTPIGNDRKLKTVLVARFSALGDVAMTIPVLYSACACYPDVKFIMVTRSSMTGMFVNPPANLQVIGVDLKNEYKGVRGMWQLVSRLKAEHRIDAFADLHDVLRTKMMRAFCRMRGIKAAKINKGRRRKRALTRSTGKVMLPLISSRARYREVFFQLGLPIDMTFEGLYGHHGKGDPALFASFAAPKQPGEKWVGIAPFAAHSGKIYPLDKMEQVVKALAERGDCRIFIFGAGGEEKATAEAWAKAYGPAIVPLAGMKAGFAAELALMSHLDAMVTMDSANMHLAAITGTRTVSVWGATHPYCGFKAWHQRDADMVQLPLSCRPCSVFGQKKCFRGDMLCMMGIKPEWIVNKINEILEG